MFSRLRQAFSNKGPGLDLPVRRDVPGDEDMDELDKTQRDLMLAALEAQRSSASDEEAVAVKTVPIKPPVVSPEPVPAPVLEEPVSSVQAEIGRVRFQTHPTEPPTSAEPVATSTNDQPRIRSSNFSSRPAAKMSKNGSESSAALRERTIGGIMKEIVIADIAAEKHKLARNAHRDR